MVKKNVYVTLIKNLISASLSEINLYIRTKHIFIESKNCCSLAK